MRRFNFRRSQELLDVDPKTFGRWLKQANIDPRQQIDKADPRQRYLTEEQLRQLAAEHERELPPLDLDSTPDTLAGATIVAVGERLTALEQHIAQRFDALEAQNRQTLQVMANLQADLQRLVANQEQTVPPQRELIPAVPVEQASSPIPAAKTAAASSPSGTSAKKQAKKTKGSKRLPRTLIPLHAFGHEHGISEKATDHAAETGKLSVTRGRWLYNSRYVTSALDQQGQHEFYTLFHQRAGFQACKTCPHTL